MSRVDDILNNMKFSVNVPEVSKDIIDLNLSFDSVKNIESKPGVYCGISELSNIFSWKKGFSYLFTGSPNTGKTTMILFLYLIMSILYGWKWCIWSPEMIDTYVKNKKVTYHAKDLIYLMIWTLAGKTPYKYYAEKHDPLNGYLSDAEIGDLYGWITDHFQFIETNDRTPAGLIEAFLYYDQLKDFDGFLIDPWKSVKQDINMRSDIWLEDILMEFKKFSYETNSLQTFIVHPKALKEYKDSDGNFRVITPFDLNGGAAWSNSMDVIVSLRRLESNTEWYTYKARKQHLIGKTGSFENITFSIDKYRFYFNGNDPIENGLRKK